MSLPLSYAFLVAMLLCSASAFMNGPECGSKLEELGISGLKSILVPCAISGNEACCASLDSFAGLREEAVVGGCFCKQAVLNRLMTRLDGNSVAKKFGFSGTVFLQRLQGCGVPHFGLADACGENAVAYTADDAQEG